MFGTIALFLIVVLALLVGTVVPTRARLLAWTLVVVAGVVPWSSWDGHAHWERIEWLPFTETIRLRDIALNVLFYVPIGWFVVARRPEGDGRQGGHQGRPYGGPLLAAALFGLGLSLITEATQTFSHRRFPSATDVLTNTTGALIGAWLVTRFSRRAAS